jgi:hypothetical protein
MSDDEILYHERLKSLPTTGFFLGLTGVFTLLWFWRRSLGDFWSRLFAIFSGFFMFYVLNYRTLEIILTPQALSLRFGVFTWRVPLENIAAIEPDELPPLMRYGGAGIHGMLIGGRYRASFNFLEYPRLVLRFKRQVGPLQDLSFSTHQPEALQRLVNDLIRA